MQASSLEEAILFVFFGLTIGAICTYLLSRYIPHISHIYTVILFFIGVFIQFLIHLYPSEDIHPLKKWNSIEG
jgi:putative Mn2+ efflux pump MntP